MGATALGSGGDQLTRCELAAAYVESIGVWGGTPVPRVACYYVHVCAVYVVPTVVPPRVLARAIATSCLLLQARLQEFSNYFTTRRKAEE